MTALTVTTLLNELETPPSRAGWYRSIDKALMALSRRVKSSEARSRNNSLLTHVDRTVRLATILIAEVRKSKL